MFKKKKDDTFVILKVIMNVSLSLNNFDWEAVVFFYFPNYNINQCMHDNL